jgi:hypothetical protein
MLPDPKIDAYGLVRDKNGWPKIDMPLEQIPEPIKMMLSPEDWEYLKGIQNGNT